MGVYNIQESINNWKITNSYSVGTIVKHGDNKYIAIADVPKGINIGYSKYWEKIVDVSIGVQIQSDLNYLSDKIGEFKNEVDDTINTYEGNPVTFESDNRQIAKSTKVDLEPIQDLHGYDKPWVGGAGKNKFDEANTILTGFSNSNGTFTNTLTDTRTNFAFRLEALKNDSVIAASTSIQVYETGRYNLSINITSSVDTLRIKHNGLNRDLSIDVPFTSQGTYNISLDAVSVNPSVVGGLVIKNIQIEAGSTATSYEPYENICPVSGRTKIDILGTNGKESTDPDYEISNDLTISIGQTVYGARHDVESGKCIVDKILLTLNGTESYTRDANNGFYIALNTMAKLLDYTNNIFCDSYQTYAEYRNMRYIDYGISGYYDGTGAYPTQNWLYIKDTRFSTTTDFTTWLTNNNVNIVYKLATPITINLTPRTIQILEGVNEITTNGDNIIIKTRNGSVLLTDELNDIETIYNKIYTEIMTKTTANNVNFKFRYDTTTQKYGYLDGTDTFHPF